MLSISNKKVQSLSLRRAVSHRIRCDRRATLHVCRAKKSRDQELEEAYQEQLAYLERRREKLNARRAPKQQGPPQRVSAAAPTSQAAPSKAKAQAAEPSIQLSDETQPKKAGGNPLGFLSALFGAK